MTQTKQFDTFDTVMDRRELVILFEKLGEQGGGMECPRARQVRAMFLQKMIEDTLGKFADAPINITPCSAVEAYNLFVQIVGVLDVPIANAARLLDEVVTRKDWIMYRPAYHGPKI